MSEEKYAFKMKLRPGMALEYKRRHEKIWPQLSTLLRHAGIRDYSIHLDRETNILFGVMWRKTDHDSEALAQTEIMRKWWDHMADIMEVNSDNQPVSSALETMFHLP
ncbi:MAG: L-rhamnose mutarotase [Devosiaceae bacterium]|nr:L-rhamnose mutarotase [Devosiaceae bacterium]